MFRSYLWNGFRNPKRQHSGKKKFFHSKKVFAKSVVVDYVYRCVVEAGIQISAGKFKLFMCSTAAQWVKQELRWVSWACHKSCLMDTDEWSEGQLRMSEIMVFDDVCIRDEYAMTRKVSCACHKSGFCERRDSCGLMTWMGLLRMSLN